MPSDGPSTRTGPAPPRRDCPRGRPRARTHHRCDRTRSSRSCPGRAGGTGSCPCEADRTASLIGATEGPHARGPRSCSLSCPRVRGHATPDALVLTILVALGANGTVIAVSLYGLANSGPTGLPALVGGGEEEVADVRTSIVRGAGRALSPWPRVPLGPDRVDDPT